MLIYETISIEGNLDLLQVRIRRKEQPPAIRLFVPSNLPSLKKAKLLDTSSMEISYVLINASLFARPNKYCFEGPRAKLPSESISVKTC